MVHKTKAQMKDQLYPDGFSAGQNGRGYQRLEQRRAFLLFSERVSQ
jgi:hypothetical protein